MMIQKTGKDYEHRLTQDAWRWIKASRTIFQCKIASSMMTKDQLE